MVTITTLFVSIMATIDATIVAVCLPYMQGDLDATPVTITWVLTMYNIGQAIGIAITGRLALLLGRRNTMLLAVIGFVVLSCICGASRSLEGMVAARFLQGFFAAPLIPLSQATVVDVYPIERRASGLAVWAMGVATGPALGPTIGGILAQHLDWRASFYVNVPVGAAAVILLLSSVRETPRRSVRLDWTGAILISLLVIPLQIALDQGDVLDWFGSRLIVMLLGVALLAGGAFIARGLLVPNNVLKLRLFADRSFSLCALTITLLGLLLFAYYTLYPILLVDLLRWQVDTAGIAMGSFGAGAVLGAYFSPKLSRLVGGRVAAVLGIAVAGVASWMGTSLNLDPSPAQAVWPGAIANFGIMLAYVQAATLAFRTVAAEDRDDAVAAFNFVKTIGLSIGVTVVGVLIYRRPQMHWQHLGGEVRLTQPGLEGYFLEAGVEPGVWGPHVAAKAAAAVQTQALMLSVLEVFLVMIFVAIAAGAAILLSGRGGTQWPRGGGEDAAAAAG
jgi:DHA2 family multidrug resistance protein